MLRHVGVGTETWFACAALTVAAILIGYALQISNGHLNGAALILLTFALAVCATGVVAPRLPTFEQHGPILVFSTAAAGLAFQLWAMFRSPPGIYMKLSDPRLYLVYLGGIIVAGAVAALSLVQMRPQLWLPMLAAVHFAMGVWMIHVSPAPKIDVFHLQTAACDALVHGRNPYTAIYPDVYASNRYTSAQTGSYPAISYICSIPGYLAGDVRYADLAAMSLSALLIGFTRSSQLSAMAAALFLFTPRTLFVLEQSWTEPFVLLLFAGMAFCGVRGRFAFVPVFLGLLIASKQYLFPTVLVAALITGTRFRWTEYLGLITKALLVAMAVTLPFALGNPSAFSQAVFHLPPVIRTDSLSYPAWLFVHGGPYIPRSVDFLLGFVALALALWRMPRTTSGFLATAAMLYFALFLFSIGSFCNYYYMVIGLLCMAVSVSEPSRSPVT